MATIMSKEQWLRPHEAAALVRQHCGGSIGRSEELVRAAVASGEVRSVERGVQDFSQRPGSGVKKISLSNKDDLIDWLSRQTPLDIPAKAAAASTSQEKRERAKEAIRALWKDDIPAQTVLPNLPLCQDVIDWLKSDCERRKLEFFTISNDTILRAAGRK